MWPFKKNEVISDSGSEYDALEKLIQRLEETPPLTKEDESRKYKKFSRSVATRMLDEGVNRGVAAGSHAIYNQSEEKFNEHLKSTNDNLMEQISILNFNLDQWFEHGETNPPYFAWRIAVILSKRKDFDKEKRFLAAYCRHFKFCVGRRDQEITNRAIKKGAISQDGIPRKEEVISMANDLVSKYGVRAREVSDSMRTQAYDSGNKEDFLKMSLVVDEVARIIFNGL